MSENKTSISQAATYQEIGEFWDNHDLTEFWEETKPVEFEVAIESESKWHAIEPSIASKIAEVAQSRGIKTETLINVWLGERLASRIHLSITWGLC